jgi:chemotaxis protein histidine kinase CheA
MSEIQIIQSALEEAARRERWARALRGLWHGVLVGAGVSLLLIIAYKVLPLSVKVLLMAAAAPVPCMVAGLVIGGWRKRPLEETARWVDGKQKLKERLSTALEVASKDQAGVWRDLVVVDAAEHAKEIDPRRLVAFHLPKATRWAVVLLALAVGLGFVPEYRSKARQKKETDKQLIKEAGKQLLELTKHNLTKRPPSLETTQKSMEAVGTLGGQMAKQSLGRSEALKDLANVADKLKDQLKEMGKDPALRKMEQAARASGGADSQTAAGMQKQMESLQKQMGTPVGNPDALDKMKKELEKLQEAAKALADKNPASGEAQKEKQKLSEAMSALSREAQEAGLKIPELDQAIQALAANQTDMVLRDLQAATNDLEKMRDMAKSLQQMQQQMEKMGKDLAEQLKNGQPELAQQTMQKMMNQLKSSSLSQEQMEKMMQEVNKAVSPAGNYGKVSEHLKQAAKQMKSGDKAASAQSLAEASKELDKLMQQMGDAQSLQSELEALNQASMSIANGQRWGSGNRPGSGPSSREKLGGGVGDWGDDSKEWDGRWSDRWDNSGFERADQESRGHTDRGEGDLNQALSPTKVRGQFSPGGQMPSITLKGVSIKGQSKVQYEESAAAAQSDAQSALSQEKVPRAYQGAVRDYFDDLKTK